MNPILIAALSILVTLSPLPGEGQETSTASQSGQRFETEIEEGLRVRHLDIIELRDWEEALAYREPDLTAVVKNAPYTSIYGHRARMEFLLFVDGDQWLIEAKRQRAAGSVDEKLPYVFANALANIEQGREYILIIDGQGWKPEALIWIKARAAETSGFYVFDKAGFFGWLDDRLGA